MMMYAVPLMAVYYRILTGAGIEIRAVINVPLSFTRRIPYGMRELKYKTVGISWVHPKRGCELKFAGLFALKIRIASHPYGRGN